MAKIYEDELLNILSFSLGNYSPSHSQEHAGWYAFNCPACAQEQAGIPDNKYNLNVSFQNNYYHCWKCKEYSNMKGSIKNLFYKFSSKKNQNKIVDLLKYLGVKEDEKEKQIETPNLTLPLEFKKLTLNSRNNAEHKNYYNYVLNRGLTDKEIERYDIGFCSEGKYKGRIVVPSYDKEGNLNYYIARSIYKDVKPTYLAPSLKKDFVFNERYINWDSTIYLVEGIFDHFAIYNSIPLLGKQISENLLKKLLHNTLPFSDVKIVTVYDNDVNVIEKRKQMTKLATFFGESRIKEINLTDVKDFSDAFQLGGYSKITEIVKNSFNNE